MFVGIDIGTSNCCTYVKCGSREPELIPSPTGGALTPSVVAITDTAVMVGEIAQQQQAHNPLHTFFEFKRVIGRVYAQKDLWKDAKNWPFHLGRPDNPDTDAPIYHAFHAGQLQSYSALQFTTFLVRQLLQDVRTAHPNETVDHLVITVPAHFDHVQRNATLEAVRAVDLAGTNITLCNEPTAAAVAYVQAHPDLHAQQLMVFDLGAGTLDVTVLTYGAAGYEIVTSKGLGDLGGLNFTQALLQQFVQHVKEHTKKDIRKDKALWALCRELCEKAKKVLSICEETTIVLPNSPDTPAFVVTRAEFEKFIMTDLNRCRQLLADLQQQDPHNPHNDLQQQNAQSIIEHIVLVGGSARVPAVQRVLLEVFPGATVHRDIHMDQCVALGACLLAATNTVVTERLSHAIGIKTANRVMHVLIAQGHTLPCEAVQILYPQTTHQKAVEICLYQGEGSCVDENVLLGKLRLGDVQPNQPPLRLHVRMDASGMIDVEIRDPDGKTAKSTMHFVEPN